MKLNVTLFLLHLMRLVKYSSSKVHPSPENPAIVRESQIILGA